MALITEQAIQPAFAAMELQNLFMPTQASTAAATTPLQNVLTENKTYFGYATGGIAMTPQLAMVAERKPEAIIPLDDLGGIGQPPMIVINNNAGEKAPLKQGKPMRFDGKKWVVDLIIDDYTHYGDLYTLFGGK